MGPKANQVAPSAPRLLDPVTTDSAVSILRTLIASAATERPASECEVLGAEAVLIEADEPAGRMTAPKSAGESNRLSETEARALQPDIVLEEGQDTTDAWEQDEQRIITPPRYCGDDPHNQDDDALELLVDGLRTGRLIAAFIDDTATNAIPAAFWATGAGRATARQGFRLEMVGDLRGAGFVKRHAVVDKHDVYGLMGAAKPRNRGGRPVEHDWEAIMFDIWAYATDRGISKTQTQFFSDVALYLGNRAPHSETILKQRTDRVFKEIMRIQQLKMKSQKG